MAFYIKKLVLLAGLLALFSSPAFATQTTDALVALRDELAAIDFSTIPLEQRTSIVSEYQERFEKLLSEIDYSALSQLSASEQQNFSTLVKKQQCFFSMLETADLKQRFACA